MTGNLSQRDCIHTQDILENVDPGPYEDPEPGTLNKELRNQDPMKTQDLGP